MPNRATRYKRECATENQAGACFYCGAQLAPGNLSADHLWPCWYGGDDRAENIVAACRECNQLKDKLPPLFFMRIRKQLKAAMETERKIFAALITEKHES